MSALDHSRIIPDVIDGMELTFAPNPHAQPRTPPLEGAPELSIKYPNHIVANGNFIPKEDAHDEPKIDIVGHGMYTLIMSDPDAPSPDDPKWREFLHMLIINIPDGELSKGKVVTPYTAPAPPQGEHRYVFTLWRQTPPGRPETIAKEDWDHPFEVSAPEDRKCFNTRKFAAEHKLRGPVRVEWFVSAP